MPRDYQRNTDRSDDSAKKRLPGKFCHAMALLLEAFQYAEQTNGKYWEFAVEAPELVQAGLTKNDLRFLVRKQLVEHASEVTIAGQDGRSFQNSGDLTFTERTCFVLTLRGVAEARQSCVAQSANGLLRQASFQTPVPGIPAPGIPVPGIPATGIPATGIPATGTAEPCIPDWDADRRVLWFDGQVVKHFKWHAANQEAILEAFQEEGWPFRIDDPLPPQPEQDSKRRLNDTIKCLNRKQQNQYLHFRGDGTGEGVIWEAVDHSATNGKRQ